MRLIVFDLYRQPTTDNRQPTTYNQKPTTDNRQPTTDNRQPTTDNRQPTTDNFPRHPAFFMRNSGGHDLGGIVVATQARAAAPDRLSKATILGMAAMGVAVLVVANDFTALSVALPAIERELHTDVTTVQWVINGYAMVFGVLIVTGGRLA